MSHASAPATLPRTKSTNQTSLLKVRMSLSSVRLKSTRLYAQMARHGTRTSKGSNAPTFVVLIAPVCADSGPRREAVTLPQLL